MYRRNVALVGLMARAGLRIGEVLGLDNEDVRLSGRSGWVVVHLGTGLKERRVLLSSRPENPGGLSRGAAGGGDNIGALHH